MPPPEFSSMPCWPVPRCHGEQASRALMKIQGEAFTSPTDKVQSVLPALLPLASSSLLVMTLAKGTPTSQRDNGGHASFTLFPSVDGQALPGLQLASSAGIRLGPPSTCCHLPSSLPHPGSQGTVPKETAGPLGSSWSRLSPSSFLPLGQCHRPWEHSSLENALST